MITTRAEIQLRALQDNLGKIRHRVGSGVKVMGIVKANAYGHGLPEVAGALTRSGIDYLGVGFLQEGTLLRQYGIRVPILVLGGVLGSQVKEFLQYDLDITVASIEIAERIEQEASTNGNKRANVHLKIDTGMERIGVHPEHALEFVQRVSCLPHLDVKGIYSHFATSDERDKTFAHLQLERFTAVLDFVRKSGIEIPYVHMANSGAILDMPGSYFTMVRPGILLYGIYPSRETTKSIPVEPVLSLKSKVVFVKSVPEGTSISYGRTYYTPTNTRIVTVPIGYGDGYSRRLTGRGEVIIAGKRFPVVGTVCMDQIMVDGGIEGNIHVGDDVALIGSDGGQSISVWEIADLIGTNPYEVLTGISARVPRVVIN